MAVSQYRPEYIPKDEKKTLRLGHVEPDVTRSATIPVPGCYEYPYSEAVDKYGVRRPSSEHHYDVPHLNSDQSSSGQSLSSCTCSSDSALDSTAARPEHSPDIDEGYKSHHIVTSTVTQTGGRIFLPDSMISLTIPEGALRKGDKMDVYLASMRDDKYRPTLKESLTQLSPVVQCGPAGKTFLKPVIVYMPHCANLQHADWKISIWSSNPSFGQSSWQKVVTLGEETINTPVFTQLDAKHAYLVTDQLTRFVMVGEANDKGHISYPIKLLRVAVFATPLSALSDFTFRIYVLEDTMDAIEDVTQAESKQGGLLMDKTKTLFFQDGGSNLTISLEDISPGWKVKSQVFYHEILFRDIWNCTQNNLHRSFTLERLDSATSSISVLTVVNQNGFPNHCQSFRVKSELCTEPCSLNVPPAVMTTDSNCRTVTSSSGCGSSVTTYSSTPFRFTRALRREICDSLDRPNAKGNDWRMLAEKLNVDRYINYFATKASPTDHILDLWEARHREPTSVTDLVNVLRLMGRNDVTALMEAELGPWL
uniref:Netrin receptor UNC5 n=2 Tax=Clastoptera arizonana TaxID=38151 RepID=A0A1B6EE00_9HEMI